jgi:hypothetical protein
MDMNAEYIADHSQGIAHRAHFAVGIEVPLNRNLPDAHAFSPGKVEDFNVERPAAEGLLVEKFLGRPGSEAFEAALGIV